MSRGLKNVLFQLSARFHPLHFSVPQPALSGETGNQLKEWEKKNFLDCYLLSVQVNAGIQPF